uniref:Uncharacterized protein n=1 Tax=Lepeophtheirus salmonis TaxID=72036 RepID=A0A0K2TA88_LEPSM
MYIPKYRRCFIHCHISTQKLGFITLDHLQTLVRFIHSSLFLFKSELARHPLYTEPSHTQIHHITYDVHVQLISLECLLLHSISIYGHSKSFCGFF